MQSRLGIVPAGYRIAIEFDDGGSTDARQEERKSEEAGHV